MFWRSEVSDEDDWLGKVAAFVRWEANGEQGSTGLASHMAPSVPSYLTFWFWSVETFWVRCDVNETCSKSVEVFSLFGGCAWSVFCLCVFLNTDLSLLRFISAELTRGYFLEHNEAKYTERRERVYTCMRIPKELEKVKYTLRFVLI